MKSTVQFAGPFSWEGASDAPSFQYAAERHESGVYLWTIPLPEGHLVCYVGMTAKSFAARMEGHDRCYAAAKYHVYRAESYARGEKLEKDLLWEGMWHYETEASKSPRSRSQEECWKNCARLKGPTQEMKKVQRFFFAPLFCDTRTVERIEAAIAEHLKGSPDRRVRDFLTKGIRYRPTRKHEQPFECTVSSQARILGIPERLRCI